jgi:hypothetical protein
MKPLALVRKAFYSFKRRKTANWFGGNYVSAAAPVLIGGCARSGTTLLRVMLVSHHNLCGGPESWLFVLPEIDIQDLGRQFDMPVEKLMGIFQRVSSRGEFIEVFFHEYCRQEGKERWVDKTPKNVTRLPFIFRTFPNARFIHMIRDGRDVACSLFARKKRLSMDDSIKRWVADIEASRKYWSDPRYLEIRYENLVLETQSTLEKVLNFIDEPWDQSMLRYHEIPRDVSKLSGNPKTREPVYMGSIGRWKDDFADDYKSAFKRLAGELLIELRYESSDDW